MSVTLLSVHSCSWSGTTSRLVHTGQLFVVKISLVGDSTCDGTSRKLLVDTPVDHTFYNVFVPQLSDMIVEWDQDCQCSRNTTSFGIPHLHLASYLTLVLFYGAFLIAAIQHPFLDSSQACQQVMYTIRDINFA